MSFLSEQWFLVITGHSSVFRLQMVVSEVYGFKWMIGTEHIDSSVHQLFPKLWAFIFRNVFVNPNANYLVVLLKPFNVLLAGARWLAIYAFAPSIGLRGNG